MTDYAKMSTDELLEELISQAKDVGEYANGVQHSLQMASQAGDRIIKIRSELLKRTEAYGL